jgi:5'-methylthioadenosine phosphorylase
MEDTLRNVEFGVIGGSGFYNMKGIKNSEYVTIETPFGSPSEKILIGEVKGEPIAFLSRHGIGHPYNPSQVNYRANLFAMKRLSVKKLISVTAVGSLKESIKPTDLVIPDQYVDNTFKREKTFFDDGISAHVSMADPTCPFLTRVAYQQSKNIGLRVHKGGTYFNMEGPQFSSKAESNVYRNLGFSVIGMTQAVESKLAKEAEMCFLPLSFVTDYDCWHEEAESVSVELVLDNLRKNAEHAEQLIESVVETLKKGNTNCDCGSSLQNAIITNPELISPGTKKKLNPIIGKYFPEE